MVRFCFAAALLLFAADAKAILVLTGIVDGTLSGQPRAFEMYTSEAITDFEAEYQFQYASNSNSYQNTTTAFGAIPADSFFYVVNSLTPFTNSFGTGLITSVNGGITPTGNDSGRILLKSDSSVIDEAYTNSSSSSVYQDSFMYRLDFTTADSSYNSSNWEFGGNNLLDDKTAAEIGALVPFGTFQATMIAAIPEPTSALFGSLLAGALGVTVARRPNSRD